MFVNKGRLYSVTDAKPKLNALVADAERGHVTHILKNADIVAHLVPANVWIHADGQPLQTMVELAADATAAIVSRGNGWDGDRLYSATDAYGQILAWAWRCDAGLFGHVLAAFHAALERHLGHPVTREQLRPGIENSVGAGLDPSEVLSVADYLRAPVYWTRYYPHPQAPFKLPSDNHPAQSSRDEKESGQRGG